MELSLEELANFANEFATELPQEVGKRAHVIGLSGELGAGKTTFVQMVGRALEVADTITSPTFVLAKNYPIARFPFLKLVHIDAYRLTPSDKDTIGFTELLQDPHALIFVEWPEHLRDFPKDAATIHLAVTGTETRALTHHVTDQ